MKKSSSGTSIIEVMVVLVVITSSIIWAFKIFVVSTQLSTSTKNRIQAIQIAREGIEAFTNIRDTNWILFSADYENCWNTLNYDQSCIWDNLWTSTYIEDWKSYIVYQAVDNRWNLELKPTGNYSAPEYRDSFKIYLDSTNSLYTQNSASWTELLPIYTRELIVNYIDTNWWWIDSNDEKIRLTSLVQWADSSTSRPYKVELETIISNRKNKKY